MTKRLFGMILDTLVISGSIEKNLFIRIGKHFESLFLVRSPTLASWVCETM